MLDWRRHVSAGIEKYRDAQGVSKGLMNDIGIRRASTAQNQIQTRYSGLFSD